MTRSTKAQKSERLNAAYALLVQGVNVADAVQRLATQFDLSQRQAYRYVHAARRMTAPVDVSETAVPVTLKIPRNVVAALRAHARGSGLSMGEIVSRALARFFQGSDRHG